MNLLKNIFMILLIVNVTYSLVWIKDNIRKCKVKEC